MSGLRLPAQEREAIARQLSSAHSGGGKTPRVLGIVQSISGPMVLSLDPTFEQTGNDGQHESGALSADRMLSLTVVPLGESLEHQTSSKLGVSCSPSLSSLDTCSSDAEDNGHSDQAAVRSTGWADSNTTVARLVNFSTGGDLGSVMGGQPVREISVTKSLQSSSTSEDDTACLPETRRVQIQAPEILSDLLDNMDENCEHLSTHEHKEDLQHIPDSSAKDEPGVPASSTDRRFSDIQNAHVGSVHFLQHAAKNRHKRRLNSLRMVMAPIPYQPCDARESDMSCHLSPQQSLTANEQLMVTDLFSQPVLDKEHEWLMDDPDALSSALKNNPIFSIIAQKQYRGSDGGSAPSDASSLNPDDFLMSEFITDSTCFGPSVKDKEDEDPVEETVLGLHADHPIRAVATSIVLHWAFDYAMTIAIIISCGAMTLERPSLRPDSELFLGLARLNLVLNTVFGLELILKLATYGFRTYWSRTSNKIDALIVLLSVLLMAVEDSGLSIFRYGQAAMWPVGAMGIAGTWTW